MVGTTGIHGEPAMYVIFTPGSATGQKDARNYLLHLSMEGRLPPARDGKHCPMSETHRHFDRIRGLIFIASERGGMEVFLRSNRVARDGHIPPRINPAH
jgi:hypothetical protein